MVSSTTVSVCKFDECEGVVGLVFCSAIVLSVYQTKWKKLQAILGFVNPSYAFCCICLATNSIYITIKRYIYILKLRCIDRIVGVAYNNKSRAIKSTTTLSKRTHGERERVRERERESIREGKWWEDKRTIFGMELGCGYFNIHTRTHLHLYGNGFWVERIESV